MILKTKRLIIRPWKKGDEESLIEDINDIRVSKYLSQVPHPYKNKDARWWIKHSRDPKRISLAILLKSENKAIGGIGLHDIDKTQGNAELGYWLGKRYWRQGLVSEATEAILDYAFKKLKLRRVYAMAYIENVGSNLLLRKMGFKREGLLRKHGKARSTGKVHDAYIYGLLKEGWK